MSDEKSLDNIFPTAPNAQVVNSYTTQAQKKPTMAGPDAQGRILIVWQSLGQDGSDEGIFGQFYDKDDNKEGSEFQINTETIWHQQYPEVCKLDNDCWVVVWQNGRGSFSIFGQKLQNNGTKAGPAFQVNTFSNGKQDYPSISHLKNNEFVVVWRSYGQNGTRYNIDFQRYNSAVPVGTETIVDLGLTSWSSFPAVTRLNDGGFFIVWSSGTLGFGTIYGQRFDDVGNMIGSRVQISSQTTGLSNPDVAQFPNGELLVVWIWNLGSVQTAGIYGQRLNLDGTKIGDIIKISSQQLPLSTDTFDTPHIIVANDLAMITYDITIVSVSRAHLQLIDFTGKKIGPEMSVTDTLGNQSGLRGLFVGAKATLVWSGDEWDGDVAGIVKRNNIPKFFIIFDDIDTNNNQNYLYIEDSTESKIINLSRTLVNSAAPKITIRYQSSNVSPGLLQFSDTLPTGVTITPYNKDSGIIEVSGTATGLNQMPDLEFVLFPNANANVDISVEVAENNDWVNAIKVPNAKHLIGTPINDPIERSNKPLPKDYNTVLVLKDYFNDIEGFAGVTFRIFISENLIYELGAEGQILLDNTATLDNLPLVLTNNGTAIRVLRQPTEVVYRVEAIDGFFKAQLEWIVPALVLSNEPSAIQKGFILAGRIVGYAAASVVGALIAYSPVKKIRNALSNRDFSHELNRMLSAKIDPDLDPTESTFWLLFAEPTIQKIFASGHFYRFRGGVSDREIEHLVQDSQILFAGLYSQGYQQLQSAVLIECIEQLKGLILSHYQALYDAAVAETRVQIEREIEAMSPSDDNDENHENAILLSTLTDSGSDAVIEKAKARVNDKKLKLMHKAVESVMEDNPLKDRVAELHELIANSASNIVHQHASKGGSKWYGKIGAFGKRTLRFLRIKSFGSSRTVNTNMAEITRKTLLTLQRYAIEYGITIDEETGARIQAQYENNQQQANTNDNANPSSYAAGQTALRANAVTNPVFATHDTGTENTVAAGVGPFFANGTPPLPPPPPLPHATQARLLQDDEEDAPLRVVTELRN